MSHGACLETKNYPLKKFLTLSPEVVSTHLYPLCLWFLFVLRNQEDLLPLSPSLSPSTKGLPPILETRLRHRSHGHPSRPLVTQGETHGRALRSRPPTPSLPFVVGIGSGVPGTVVPSGGWSTETLILVLRLFSPGYIENVYHVYSVGNS